MTSLVSIAYILTFLGALPIVVCALGIVSELTHPDNTLHLLVAYCAIIQAFIGGVYWGVAITKRETKIPYLRRMVMIGSIVPVCFAWVVLFISVAPYQVLLSAFLFSMLWCTDSILYSEKLIPHWYFSLRGTVTPIVVVSLYIVYFNII